MDNIDINKLDWKASGIYLIKNITTGLLYVGSSKSLRDRISNHKTYLRKNKHHNLKLQHHWNKYGENDFEFSLLELCEIKELAIQEQKWMDKLNVMDRNIGFNILPIAFNQSRILGNCINCGKENIGRRKGLCHTCNEYYNRHGINRPYLKDGRIEKKNKYKDMLCPNCNRPYVEKKGSIACNGICIRCNDAKLHRKYRLQKK